MGLHEDLVNISHLDSTTALFGIIQSGDIQSPELFDRTTDDYPGLSSLTPEIMGMFEAMGQSDEYIRGAGIGALLVVRVLVQYAEASRIEPHLPRTTE